MNKLLDCITLFLNLYLGSLKSKSFVMPEIHKIHAVERYLIQEEIQLVNLKSSAPMVLSARAIVHSARQPKKKKELR